MTMLRSAARLTALALALALALVSLAARPAHADPVSDARATIGKQMELIKKGDLKALKATFTARLRDRITDENVKAARKDMDSYTLDDLVASVARANGGLKIKMKNGRTLTTLVKLDGTWVADTLWFK